MNPTSPLRNSLGVSLFQLDPLSWVSFNRFLVSTILILSTKGATWRTCCAETKRSYYHWRICWGQEEEWSSRGSAAEDPPTVWGHEEATWREQSRPSENLAGERCWCLFSALIPSLPPVLVGSELFWWCDELFFVLWSTIYLLSVVVWWTICRCNLCCSFSVISCPIISSVMECSPFG